MIVVVACHLKDHVCVLKSSVLELVPGLISVVLLWCVPEEGIKINL